MTHFGKIINYDGDKGFGTIKPEAGGNDVRFTKDAAEQAKIVPANDQRLSYEVEKNKEGRDRAVKLQTA